MLHLPRIIRRFRILNLPVFLQGSQDLDHPFRQDGMRLLQLLLEGNYCHFLFNRRGGQAIRRPIPQFVKNMEAQQTVGRGPHRSVVGGTSLK